ncbi:MAG: YhbY family RNA-binding protein [Betaproteobacteria bacterium]|nr:YhbY family RNA-binding protein [Betaproteobacteria bacterium]
MKELTPAERRDLRARAHHLDPVVSIAANGLSATVLQEIDRSLKAHELIKIRVYSDDRDLRGALMAEICKELLCSPVQSIGKLLIVYRPEPKTEKTAQPSLRKPSVARPKALKPESGRTARTTRGTSAVRRSFAPKPTAKFRSSAARKPGKR